MSRLWHASSAASGAYWAMPSQTWCGGTCTACERPCATAASQSLTCKFQHAATLGGITAHDEALTWDVLGERTQNAGKQADRRGVDAAMPQAHQYIAQQAT